MNRFFRFAVCGFAVLSGCASSRSLHMDIGEHVQIPDRCAIVFFVDGVDRARLRSLLAEGKLPNIQRRFIEGGVSVENAVASLPSVTYANCSAALTGLFPGHHNIMGNNWFDRRTLELVSYGSIDTYQEVNEHLAVPTIYDLLGDWFTVNIAHHHQRGVSETIDNKWEFATCWMTGRFRRGDRFVATALEEVAALANRKGEWPILLMTYYPGVDEIGHRYGPRSRRYEEALINIDGIVGRVTEAIHATPLADRMHYVLTTDHGMVECEQAVNLVELIEQKQNINLRTRPLIGGSIEDRARRLNRYAGVATDTAGRVLMIHLKGEQGWQGPRVRPHEAVVASLLALGEELPSIELTVMRHGPNQIGYQSRSGGGEVQRRTANGIKEYRHVTQVDGDGDDSWRSSEQWLTRSAADACPDFVPQLFEMFDSPRVGDIVYFAADGWCFSTDHDGGHGGCASTDMHIPMHFAGADLPRGTSIPAARLVDLMPTLLGLLNESDRLEGLPMLDGVDRSLDIRGRKKD